MVEITKSCNLNCLFCSSDAGPPLNLELGSPELEKVSKYVSDLAVEKLEITGGEPFNRQEKVITLLKGVNSLNTRISVYSSGSLTGENGFESLSTEKIFFMASKGVNEFVFNLQGVNEKTHDFLAGTEGSYQRTIESLKNCDSAEMKAGIHFVPTKSNLNQFTELIDMASKMGVAYVKLMRFIPSGRGKNVTDLALEPIDFRKIVKKVKSLNKKSYKTKVKIGFPADFWERDEEQHCSAGQDHFMISADGRIFPCVGFSGLPSELIEPIIPKESLFDNDLESLVNQMQSILAKHANTNETNCVESCERSKLCQGGCLAQRLLHYGRLDHYPDHLCPKYKTR